MDLLTPLQNLWSNVKNVTLPGVFAALAFVILLWPPPTYDRVPTVIDNHPDIAALRLEAGFFGDESADYNVYLSRSTPACWVKEGSDSYRFLTIPTLRDRREVAVKNQLILDDIDRTLLKCVEEEQALMGIEDQAIINVNALITTRTAVRDGINTGYQKYVLSLSDDMAAAFKIRLDTAQDEIDELQAEALNLQRIQKERLRRVAELQRLDGEMKMRLADAGRLRPTQKFDDILSGLSNHILGFLTLVVGWGLLLDPLCRAIFSYMYEYYFDDAWDDVRPQRQSPGQAAYEEWNPQPDPINSNSALSWLAIAIIGFIAVLVIWCWNPSESVPRTTAIVLCPSATSVEPGKSITLHATVIAPGYSVVPTGMIKFFGDGANSPAEHKLDDRGEAIYETEPLKENKVLTATYEGPATFQKSVSAPLMESIRNPQPPPIEKSDALEKCGKPTTVKCRGNVQIQSPLPSQSQTQTYEPVSCVSAIPDPKPQLPSLTPVVSKCIIVTLLACGIAFFVPGVLRRNSKLHGTRPSDEQRLSQDLVKKLAKQLAKQLKKDPNKATPEEQTWVDEFVRELAVALNKKLGPDIPEDEQQALRENLEWRLEECLTKTLPTIDQEEARDLVQELLIGLAHRGEIYKRALSDSEAKLAEELLQKLVKGLTTKTETSEEQQLADDVVQALARDLVKRLAEDPRAPLTPEQTSAKNFVQELAEDLVKKLAEGLKTPPATSEVQGRANAFVQILATNLAKKLGQDKEAPTDAEQKLAEELLKKLAKDMKASPATSSEQKLANDLMQKLAKDMVKRLVHDSKKTCEEKLARDWKKISQPSYAIGQGLMLRSDLDTLNATYYSLSLISTGLMFPLGLLVLAILITPQVGFGGSNFYVSLFLGELMLLITGVDLRHKYTTELEGLISGAYLKLCKQNEKSASDSNAKNVSSQIADALKAAKIMKETKLEVVPENSGQKSSGGVTPPEDDKKKKKADDAGSKAEDALKAAHILKKTKLKIIPGDPPTAPTPPVSPPPTTPTAPASPTAPTASTGGTSSSEEDDDNTDTEQS
jgi:hypothetical protein